MLHGFRFVQIWREVVNVRPSEKAGPWISEPRDHLSRNVARAKGVELASRCFAWQVDGLLPCPLSSLTTFNKALEGETLTA